MQNTVVLGGDQNAQKNIDGVSVLVTQIDGDASLVLSGTAEAGLTSQLDGDASLTVNLDGEATAILKVNEGAYPEYTGDTEVTPTTETQTLETAGTSVLSNITINPIPSNYGLITWNGSYLTVS